MGPERSERERERASDAGEAKQAAAACRRAKRAAVKQQLGRRVGARARVASWAARGEGQRVSVEQSPVGHARQGRPREEEGEEGRAGWVGPEGVFLPFFSNQMFIKFYFLHFHF